MPALAVGRELRKQSPGIKLIYVGNTGSLEERLAMVEGIDFFSVSIKPLRRGVLFPNLAVPFLAGNSIIQARKILRQNNVKMVFGSGGFSSWPACAAARFMRLPYYLTDGNAYPGLVTRLLGRKAAKIYIAFDQTKDYFGSNANNFLLTGFPVSDSIGRLNKHEARIALGLDPDRITLLATGGSGGARTINQAISGAKDALIEQGYNLIWQTGKQWETENATDTNSSRNFLVEKFLEPARMAAAIAAADIAVTRCGIMTLSELAVAGLPALLVPFPYSAEGHQEANAQAVEMAGGGIMIRDKDLTPERLLQTLNETINQGTLARMSANFLKLARPDAARLIAANMLGTVNA